MAAIGPGAREIRIKGDDGQYRVIYVAKFADAIHVLHAFQKRRSGPAGLISNWQRNDTTG
jgi:phage-related protein